VATELKFTAHPDGMLNLILSPATRAFVMDEMVIVSETAVPAEVDEDVKVVEPRDATVIAEILAVLH